MNANDYCKNTLEKERIIKQSLNILKTCDYDYFSDETFMCEQQMKDFQQKWKTIGSAGNKQKQLGERFQYIQNQFWKHIELMRKKMQLLEWSNCLDDMRDDFKTASYLAQRGKMKNLGSRIEEMQDRFFDLEYEISQLKEELGI